MNSLPDPTFFLQLSETFIKTARLDCGGDRPRLSALREISSAELVSQPNPILQIAGVEKRSSVPVIATLSLGETAFHCQSFDQIGFSTLTEFIGQKDPMNLGEVELGVFEFSSGMPAPTASADALDLVFCGFNSRAIPELSDAFPNLDANPTSITLAVLDQFRFLKSQCKDGEQILLVEIANDETRLFLIGKDGLVGFETVNFGRHALYETMAEVLHLHYIGSAVKLFIRSGFDSSELAPRLGEIFGGAIQACLAAKNWTPPRAHLTGLVQAQSWFQMAILGKMGLEAFTVDLAQLPFEIDASIGELSPTDTEIVAKIYTTLTSDEDHSWQIDYVGSLSKSTTIPRREPIGSNPPFPTAHPDRVPEPTFFPVETEEVTAPQELALPEPIPIAPPAPVPPVTQTVDPQPRVEKTGVTPKKIEAIPAHILSDIEEYEGEFEDVDDYGGGTGRMILKWCLMFLSIAVVAVLVTVVFFPRASEKYLGITPPHIDFDRPNPNYSDTRPGQNPNGFPSSGKVTETDVALGLQELREERKNMAFGGLYLPTNPSGATVMIGDMSPQLSPIKLPNMEPGAYEITISKDGYETQILSVTIEPKQVLRIETVNLNRLR